jgi:hypothetical protein
VARQSAEARAAATFRAGAASPAPPKHLSRDARAVWIAIAASKPADWFDAGAQPLLESYCELTVQARAIAKKLARLRKGSSWEESKAFERRLEWLSLTLSTLGTKLRLTVQAQIDRRSGRIGERGATPIRRRSKAADRLLGGQAVWGKPN